jgi:hypothetical protein
MVKNSGRGNRTPDLQGMSLTSCHCSIPQLRLAVKGIHLIARPHRPRRISRTYIRPQLPIESVPGRSCTCDLKVRNLAFCLLNYGNMKRESAHTVETAFPADRTCTCSSWMSPNYATFTSPLACFRSRQGDMHPSSRPYQGRASLSMLWRRHMIPAAGFAPALAGS